MAISKRVQYSGRVQGVGFRYTVEGIARAYPVAGWVRNLRNGDVELVAEGDPQPVQDFVAAVEAKLADYIEKRVTTDQPPVNLRGFQIRY